MDAKPNNEMKGIVTWFGELLKTQGGTYAILIWLIFTQQTQIQSFQEKVDTCNDRHIAFIEQQSGMLVAVLDKFTDTVDNFSYYLKEQKK